MASNVPSELHTSLDGPKWAAPSSTRRSQFHATDAPAKPCSNPDTVQVAHLQSASRRLFSQSASSEQSSSEQSSSEHSVSREDQSSSDDHQDGAVTPPPPARSADIDTSFFGDLAPRVPPPAFLQDLRTLGQTAAVIASGIAGTVVQSISSHSQSRSDSPSQARSESPSQSQYSDSTQSDSLSPFPDPSPLPAHSVSPPPPTPSPIMPTTLPQSKDIKLKELREFNGNPAQLTFFDTNIRDTLDRWDTPAYHGGCITGNIGGRPLCIVTPAYPLYPQGSSWSDNPNQPLR